MSPSMRKAKLKKDERTGRWGMVIETDEGDVPMCEKVNGEYVFETYDSKHGAQFAVDSQNHRLYELELKKKFISYRKLCELRYDDDGRENQIFNIS